MSQTIQVSVTDEDIAKGEQFNCHACPIALSLCRIFPDALRVKVESSRIEILPSRGASLLVANPPVEARRFILNFDSGLDKVHPLTFELTFNEDC